MHMSAQPPSAIELEFARRYDQEHARACLQPRAQGLAGRLGFWREERLVRNALKVAGEPGLILDVACGVGRFWSVLAEHANRVILAADPSQDILDHARTHHPQSLLKRIRTFQSSAFSIGLPENAVDCICCMLLFQHIACSEHRLALLREFHRVGRDTVIVAVRVSGRFKGRPTDGEGLTARPLVSKAEVEAEFKQAGFCILSHQDFLPGFAPMRVYVLRKAG
jgi:SAM-dependent methyltransferase